MFKRVIPLLLALLFLGGCSLSPDQPTPTATPGGGLSLVPPATSTAPATAAAPTTTVAEAGVARVTFTPKSGAGSTSTIAPTRAATRVAATPTTAGANPTNTAVATRTLPAAPSTVTAAPGTVTAAPSAETSPLATGAALASGPTPTIDAALVQQIDQIEADTQKLRGLTAKTAVPEHFASPQEMAADLEQQTRKDYTPADAKQDALELWLLRLINDRNIDLLQLQINLLGEQVIGYYDPERKQLFVREDQGTLSPEAEETLAHEFTHALQDQYYDLQKLRPQNLNDDDRLTAATALVEGDASLSGLLYAQTYMSPDEFQQLLNGSGTPSPELDNAPAYIRDSLLFPYDQGSQFVAALLQSGAFAAVDKALADPPTSSEQILHPEKYLSSKRDDPMAVSLAPLTDTLGSGWTMSEQNTLGEFDLSEMLQANNVSNYQAAAAGWGGSAYALYQKGDDGLLFLDTKWDTTKDAAEFETALQNSFKSYSKQGDLWSSDGRFFGYTRSGSEIKLIASTDSAAVTAALAAVK